MRQIGYICLAGLFVMCTSAYGQQIRPANPLMTAPATTPAVPHQFMTSYPVLGGSFNLAQPAFSDISGTFTAAQCAIGSTSALGCLQVGGGLSVSSGVVQLATLTSVTHKFVTSINAGGIPQLVQPDVFDLTTSLTGLLVANGAGINAFAGASCTNQVITALDASGAQTCSTITSSFLNGVYSNISGTGTLLAGATGTGFTINFTASTISGVLSGINGGTGVANTGKTLTLGANLATTGTGAATLAFTSSPFTYTFPAISGTVLTDNSTATLTNKSISAAEINSGIIASAQGGTGVNNSGSTITITGNVSVTGSNPLTINVPASSNVTVPTTGTLISTAKFNPAALLTTTGGATPTFAFPGAGTPTYTFPAANSSLVGTAVANTFTANQLIDLNAAAFPTLPGTAPSLGIVAADTVGTVLASVAAGAFTVYKQFRTDGTLASKSALGGGEPIGNLNWAGWDGTAWSAAQGQIQGSTAEAWNAGAHGTKVTISATPNGSTTEQVEATYQNGVGFGSGTPQGAGTANAPNGFYVGTNNVISSARGFNGTNAIFSGNAAAAPGGLPAAVATVIAVDGTRTGLNMVAAGTGVGGPFMSLFAATGTVGSPAAAGTTTLGSFHSGGYDGSAWIDGAVRFRGAVNATGANWTTADHGAVAVITATPRGSTTNQIEVTLQNGLALGSGVPQAYGSANAPAGFYINTTNVITSGAAGNFTGGLSAGLASSAAALAYACYNSSTGAFTYDASSTCLVSSLRFKHDVQPISNAMRAVMAFQPIEFVYNDESVISGRQVGLSAESVAHAYPELATYDSAGAPEKVKYFGVIGLLVAAIQQQQKEIDELRGR